MEQVLERAQEGNGKDHDAEVEPRVMHRKGSAKGLVEDPQSLKERLIYRRQQLDLSQGEVAEQIRFWNNKQKETKTLSRSAYCMYESGEVVPDLNKIGLLSKVLKCAPEWLAFGLGESSTVNDNLVDLVEYNATSLDFETTKAWPLDDEWVQTRFDAEPAELALAIVNDFSPSLKPGDVAVVRRGVEPNATGAEFIFVQDDEMKIAHITRPNQSKPVYRVYEPDLRHHVEVPAEDLNFLGKVVGRMGDI